MGAYLRKFYLGVLMLTGFTTTCFSATINWKGTTSTDWGTASNWNPAVVPTSADNVRIGVVAFTNQPVVGGNYSVNNLVFGALQAATLTVNSTFTLTVGGTITQNFGAGTAGTNNTSPTTLTFTTVLTGAGTIYCTGNFIIGTNVVPANYAANLYQVSSQITQLTINGNLQLNAYGNGAAGISNQNYPALTIDNNTVTLNGQIVTSSTGSPTSGYYYTYNPYLRFFNGLGTVSSNNAFSSTGVANTNATTLELTNTNPISGGATALTNGFYVVFDAQGTGGGTVIYDATSGTQTIYTASDVPFYNSVYNGLTLSGASTKAVDAGTLSIGYEGGNLRSTNGTVNFNTNNPVVTDYNDWNNFTTVNEGTGAVNITGNLTNGAAGTINGNAAAASTAIASKLVNNGTVTCNAESFSVTGTGNNGGTFTAGSGTVSVGGAFVNSGTLTGGSGTATFTGKYTNTGTTTGPTGSGSAMYFKAAYVSTAGIFNASTGYVDFFGPYTINSGSLTANSGEVEWDDNYTNYGTFTASSGLSYFGGKAAQALSDYSTNGTVFNNVTFYCKATMTTAGTGLFAVSPTGVLTIFDDGTYAARLTAGDNVVNAATSDSYLTLQSNATSSASVAAITGNTSIKGNVNVQRFITGGSGYRGYRLLSSPVFVFGTADYSLNYPINNAYVKGSTGTAGGFDAAGNPNIYLYRENLVPSNATFTSGNWRGVNAINNATAYNYSFDNESSNYYIYPGQGFLFFFRGSRKVATITTESVTTYVPTNDTLTATGILNQGSIAAKYWYSGTTSLGYTVISTPAPGNGAVIGFNCVGNPYACTIDLNTAGTAAGSGIQISASLETNFYELNPHSQNYDVWSSSLNNGNNDATRYIVSGQGFFVRADAAGQTITFNETAKNTAQQNVNPYLFMARRIDGAALGGDKAPAAASPAPADSRATAITTASLPKSRPAETIKPIPAQATIETTDTPTPLTFAALAQRRHDHGSDPSADRHYLRLKLSLDTQNRDDILLYFNRNASANYVMNEDAVYRKGNGSLSLYSLSADDVPLVINQMPYPKLKPAIIPLNVSASVNGVYNLALSEVKHIPSLYDIWLMDAYKKDSLDMRHNNGYLFDISTTDTNSYGAHRFTLVIRENRERMIHLLSFGGSKITTGNLLSWTTENEMNYTGFTLQRSTDGGATFTGIETAVSDSAGSYNYLDKVPAAGANKYRLQMTDLNGTITYSSVVTIMYANTGGDIALNGLMLYPNPASTTLNVAFNPPETQPGNTASTYRVQITNSAGAVVKSALSAQASWQSDVRVLAPGTYVITVVNSSTNSVVGKSTFVKL